MFYLARTHMHMPTSLNKLCNDNYKYNIDSTPQSKATTRGSSVSGQVTSLINKGAKCVRVDVLSCSHAHAHAHKSKHTL